MEKLLINALVEVMEEERALFEARRKEFVRSLFRTAYALEVQFEAPETLTPVSDEECPF